ncbi:MULTISPECIES: hypothetical protein [Niastella]|uniref:Uncharacterized protein n=1 Tax=Niastella soli TaxID=2821487 RepID=A0ABS3Z577_9BACT|nr:hypothetical protein [Niastella soli]MBO9205306.1 hypothetical protein [Niastella soli]
MMNTIRKFLKDVISIFSAVSDTRKLIVRTIVTKGALELSYARPTTTSTTQFGRRAAIATKSDLF